MFHSGGTTYPRNYVMTSWVDFCVKLVKIPNTNARVEMYIMDCAGQSIFNQVEETEERTVEEEEEKEKEKGKGAERGRNMDDRRATGSRSRLRGRARKHETNGRRKKERKKERKTKGRNVDDRRATVLAFEAWRFRTHDTHDAKLYDRIMLTRAATTPLPPILPQPSRRRSLLPQPKQVEQNKEHYENASFVIVVYDIASRESFESVATKVKGNKRSAPTRGAEG